MKRNFVLVLVSLIILLILSACGDQGPTTDLKVNMTDFMFDPATYTVPAGETITLELTNNGSVTHEFVIMKFGTDIGSEFDDADKENVYWETQLDPGSSETFTFTAPNEPGEYQVVCGVEGHFQAGMLASMIVVAP